VFTRLLHACYTTAGRFLRVGEYKSGLENITSAGAEVAAKPYAPKRAHQFTFAVRCIRTANVMIEPMVMVKPV